MEWKKISDLNEMYREAESVDRDLQAEQRTNCQLIAGDHYQRSGSRYWNHLRDTRQVSPEQRLRLTKNHIAKIVKLYRNAITSASPGVTIVAKNERELKDQKLAELNKKLWDDLKFRHHMEKKVRSWAKDYVELGECITKVFWDPDAGIQVGWKAATDENGMPITDPATGSYVSSQVPAMSGDLVFETIHGFDFRRDPTSKSMDEAQYLGFCKMAPIKDLKKKYADDEAKLKFIQESTQDTFRVFQGANNTYKATKDLVLVRELYFKPCADYPNGAFYIFTELGILEQGELPFGIFPIVYEGFDDVTTSPRHHSIIRQLRPYQIEINRAASKMAEHQITIGDTKVFLMSGSKPSSGANKPGIRYETITGSPPIVVPGQTGDQYIPYIEKQIAEMYQVADVQEDIQEINNQLDPYTMLFRSMKQKKKFSLYCEKFEQFLVEVCYLSLKLLKQYASDQYLAKVIGPSELVNLPLLKEPNDIHWQIKAEPQCEDIETKMGKQLMVNHALQYLGGSMKPETVGKLLRLSPYLNNEKLFEDATLEYDISVNDILALDRGEYPDPVLYIDHDYQIKRLSARCKQPDFKFLPENVKVLYKRKISEHEQVKAEELAEIKRQQAEFIPSGGYLVTCDLYITPDPSKPETVKRVRIPSESLQWLLKQLETQGSAQQSLQQEPPRAVGEIMGMANNQPMLGAGQPPVME